MLRVEDILTDLDVLAVDSEATTDFGDVSSLTRLSDKRRIAVDDWLAGKLQSAGLNPRLHSTRRTPKSLLYQVAGNSLLALDIASKGSTPWDASSIWASNSPTADYLYVGTDRHFRSLFLTMLDGVNANSLSIFTVEYWNGGRWAEVQSLVDATMSAATISLSGGGMVQFHQPDNWCPRPLATDGAVTGDWLYWARLGLNRRPTAGSMLYQVLPVTMSRMALPAAWQCLGMLYEEAYAGNRGQWAEKADRAFKRANDTFEMVRGLLSDEFDSDLSQSVDPGDASSAVPAYNYRLNTWERG